MLYCSKCKKIYDDDEVIHAINTVTSDPEPMGNLIYMCPICGNDELEETEKCPECHNEVAPRTLIDVTDQCDGKPTFVCSDCYEDHYFVVPEEEKQ